jgi:hypothetical protein
VLEESPTAKYADKCRLKSGTCENYSGYRIDSDKPAQIIPFEEPRELATVTAGLPVLFLKPNWKSLLA